MSDVGGREMAYQDKKEIFSSRVRAGSRTYYFDIKKNSRNDNYLVVSESKHVGGDRERQRHRIMVFQEDIEKFSNSFFKIILYFIETVVKVDVNELDDVKNSLNKVIDKLKSLSTYSHSNIDSNRNN